MPLIRCTYLGSYSRVTPTEPSGDLLSRKLRCAQSPHKNRALQPGRIVNAGNPQTKQSPNCCMLLFVVILGTDLLQLVGEVKESDSHADGLQEHRKDQHQAAGLRGAGALRRQHGWRRQTKEGSPGRASERGTPFANWPRPSVGSRQHRPGCALLGFAVESSCLSWEGGVYFLPKQTQPLALSAAASKNQN